MVYRKGEMVKYKIAETYIKLDLNYNDANKERISKLLKEVARKQLVDFNQGNAIYTVIEIEEGSLKAKVVIFGTVIFNFVAGYGAFREGLGHLYHDVKAVSERIIETASDNNTVNNNLVRTEKRTGLVGKLKRTISEIDDLEHNLNNLGNNETQQRLAILRKDLANIIELLDQQESQPILNSLSVETRNNLPAPDDNGMKHMYNLYALKPEDIII